MLSSLAFIKTSCKFDSSSRLLFNGGPVAPLSFPLALSFDLRFCTCLPSCDSSVLRSRFRWSSFSSVLRSRFCWSSFSSVLRSRFRWSSFSSVLRFRWSSFFLLFSSVKRYTMLQQALAYQYVYTTTCSCIHDIPIVLCSYLQNKQTGQDNIYHLHQALAHNQVRSDFLTVVHHCQGEGP